MNGSKYDFFNNGLQLVEEMLDIESEFILQSTKALWYLGATKYLAGQGAIDETLFKAYIQNISN